MKRIAFERGILRLGAKAKSIEKWLQTFINVLIVECASITLSMLFPAVHEAWWN